MDCEGIALRLEDQEEVLSECIAFWKLEKLEEEDLMRRDGIAIVYNPLIPNDVAPGFDPMDVSTWLFSMEKKDSEKLLKVAEVSARIAPQFGTKIDIFRQTFGKGKTR